MPWTGSRAVTALEVCVLLAWLSVVAQGQSSSIPTSPWQAAPPPNIWVLGPAEARRQWLTSGSVANFTEAVEAAVIVRVIGSGAWPLTQDVQALFFQSFNEAVAGSVAMEFLTFAEGLPDPSNPDNATEGHPYVDIAAIVWEPMDPSVPAGSWDSQFRGFLLWGVALAKHGLKVQVRVMALDFANYQLNTTVQMQPVMVIKTLIAVDDLSHGTQTNALSSGNSSIQGVSPDQASAFEAKAKDFFRGWAASYVEVIDIRHDALLERYPTVAANLTNSSRLMFAETTVFSCRPDPTMGQPPFQCETSVTKDVYSLFFAADLLREQGLGNGTVLVAEVRLPPVFPPPDVSNSTLPFQPPPGAPGGLPVGPGPFPSGPPPNQTDLGPWSPWDLDLLNSRVPLSPQHVFNASADGSGVNIYLISSGVYSKHIEFGKIDGSPGTRVKPLWGFNGLDPLQDCGDGLAWYYFGTYAASLIGGLTTGIARNATIYSVRMRDTCLLQSTDIWSPGGLPSAIDAVISNFQRPGVLVIDTWWSPTRFTTDNNTYTATAILQRLNHAAELDIPIFAPVGPSLPSEDPCDNIFSQGPSVIRVASIDPRIHATILGPRNATCIDIWAPGGGLAAGITGASATGPKSYGTVMTGPFGASFLTAGVAAQILELTPSATTAELKAALQAWATSGAILGGGPLGLNLLAYTNLTDTTSLSGTSADFSTHGANSQLSGGAIAGIVIGIVGLGVLILLWFAMTKRNRRRQYDVSTKGEQFPADRGSSSGSSAVDDGIRKQLPPFSGLGARHDWEIDANQIEILARSDGSPWVLGSGRWGEVYRALKDGIQIVAVKTLRHGATASFSNEAFAREIALLQWLSRDANIVQFYGACVHSSGMMLVTELMEGGDLRAALTSDVTGMLRWDRGGKSVALDVVRGLHFLHSHGVVHRDVKSKNILLTRDFRAKLGDVGLAYIAETTSGANVDVSAHSAETFKAEEDGGVIGTFAWAAPELILGQAFSAKADMYSFGVVLWEIATHEAPVRGHLRPPSVPEECPMEVADVIAACMAVDPAARPTARQVHDTLRKCPPMEGFENRDLALPGASQGQDGRTIGMMVATPVAASEGRPSNESQGGAPSPLTTLSIYKEPSFDSDGMKKAIGSGLIENKTPVILEVQPTEGHSASAEMSSSAFVRAIGSLNPRMRSIVQEIRQKLHGRSDAREAVDEDVEGQGPPALD